MPMIQVVVEQRGEIWKLMVKMGSMVSPAGWRLQKGKELPIDRFEFQSLTNARHAQGLLEEYLNEGRGKQKKRMSKKEERMIEAQRRIDELRALGGGGGLMGEMRKEYDPNDY